MSCRGILGWALSGIAGVLVSASVVAARQDAEAPPPPLTEAGTGPGAEPEAGGWAPLPPHIQVVQLRAPRGATIEVVEPAVEPLPTSSAEDGLLVGLPIGVPYRLRIRNLPTHPESELFPVVELIGHLHRPDDIDPTRFPIRIQFEQEDVDNVLDHGQLVTHVVYLEDPDLALPLHLPDGKIPVATLEPTEEPFRVADALGRVMAVVRLGGRVPMPGEPMGVSGRYPPFEPCPFHEASGGHCDVPAVLPPKRSLNPGPVFPGDEYLCDGGDFGNASGIGPTGDAVGIDPQDAAVRFNAGQRRRVLPTNTICVYAPRFAAVRLAVGALEGSAIDVPARAIHLEREGTQATFRPPTPMTQRQSPVAAQDRRRASTFRGRHGPIEHIEIRVLNELSDLRRTDQFELKQSPAGLTSDVLAIETKDGQELEALKTIEGVVVRGVSEGPHQNVMAWKPQETAGSEEPPDRPGLAVVKDVDQSSAEPGDVVRFTIRWRNMGNTPISEVAIIDSLLPRLEYIEGSARGPQGAVFTATENRAESAELRWDLPEAIPPGGEGAVSFEARVR